MDIGNYIPKGRVENKHLLTLLDYSPEEIFELLHGAKNLKREHKAGVKNRTLAGKTLAMIFTKPSTRTRVSFEMGIRQLGGEGLFLSGADIQLGRSETIADTIRVLQRFDINGVMIRTFKQSDVEELARYGDIPVINGLTDLCHPCQVLADLLTVWEHKGRLSGLKLAFFGDGFNMANSLLAGFAKCGVNVAIACPKGGYEPDKRFIAEAEKYADITITHDPKQAAKGADIVYTDVFFSMGEAVDEEKRRLLTEFQVDGKIMAAANDGAIFMHCLPAHRGEEVTESVLESPASVVFDEAENRLHAQKAVLYYLMR